MFVRKVESSCFSSMSRIDFCSHWYAALLTIDVEPAELFHRALDEGGALLFRLRVEAMDEASAARLFNPAGSLARIRLFLFREVADAEVRTFAGKGDGHRAADAAVAAGDDGRLAVELAAAAIALLAMVRPRRHLALDPGCFLQFRR